jgi:hypothetical protein
VLIDLLIDQENLPLSPVSDNNVKLNFPSFAANPCDSILSLAKSSAIDLTVCWSFGERQPGNPEECWDSQEFFYARGSRLDSRPGLSPGRRRQFF